MRTALLLLLPCVGVAGCSTAQRANLETEAAKALVSDQEENQIGLQVKQQLEQQQHVKYLQDPQVDAYVQGIAGKILALAKRDRPDVTWQVHVIDDPKTVNAFATPGGFLYVYSGLLLAADDESEVAGVLGHESGHVVARHSARSMVDAFGLEAVTSLALGQNPSLLSKVATGIAGQGVMLAHSRSEEAEADTYGVRYASAAGFDPHGIGDFFKKLLAQEGKQPGILKYLSDHPATPERIAAVNQYIADHHLGGTFRGAAEHAAVKRRLQQIGAAGAGGPANGASPGPAAAAGPSRGP